MRSSRTPYEIVLAGGVTVAACASLLDFPDRVLDTADASSGGFGGISGAVGSGGSSGIEAGSGGSIASDASDAKTEEASVDAAKDAPIDKISDAYPYDAGPPNPGAITCGATECSSIAGDVCCIDPVAQTMSCMVANDCPASSLRVFCDEAADCLAGDICCATVGDGTDPFFRAECLAECTGGGTLQLCKSEIECAPGNCAPHPCSGGAVVQSCVGCP